MKKRHPGHNETPSVATARSPRRVLRACKAARPAAALIAALASAGFPEAFAQTAATPAAIAVDATAAGTPVEPIWAYHGYDECNYTTTADGTSLLGIIGASQTTPPAHIRSHFLLNTGSGVPSPKWGSTNVYTTDATGAAVYDWTLMDGIMDTITDAGALPYVEIGFMPEALSTHPTPYQNSTITSLNGGCFYPPTDYTKWADLISQWATHSNARYAAVESNWQWELWNEPDNAYWQGTPAEYDELYDYTEAALHKVLPKAMLGGPATASVGSFLTQFLQHCATGTNAVTGTQGTRLDLVSFHAKGGVASTGGNAELDLGHQLTLHSNGFQAVAAVPQFKSTPIVISEADPDGCAACIETQPSYRTSPAYGAYEVVMMKRTLELEANLGVNVRGVLAWAFLFENEPLFAAYRVLATNGIDLPVLNAFKLLGSLQGTSIPVTSTGAQPLASILAGGVKGAPDIDAMATLSGQQVRVLVWNYHDVLQAVAASPVSLSVKVPASFGATVTVSHVRVDDSHGDAYTTWVAQGSPATPTAAQLAALQQAMVPSLLQPDQTVAVAAGAVSLTFDLPRFGLSLITVSAGDADASAAGGAGPVGVDAGAPDATTGSADAMPASGSAGAPSSSGGSSPSGGSPAGGSGASSGVSSGGTSSGSSSPAGSTGATDAGALPAGGNAAARGTKGSGCGCSVGPQPSLAESRLTLLALLAFVGRRRSRSKAQTERRARYPAPLMEALASENEIAFVPPDVGAIEAGSQVDFLRWSDV